MANTDILTRLLLNTDDFDRKIGRSKKQTDSMALNFEKAGKVATKAFVGIAGAIGAATTAQGLFNKAIASSDSLSDKYKGTMLGLNTAVNEFFHGITTGDWSKWNQGIDNMIEKSQTAVDNLKKLANMNQAYSFLSAEDNYTFNEAITNIRDKKFTGDKGAERTRAQEVINRKTEQTTTLLNQAAQTLAANLAVRTGISADLITPERIGQVYESVLAGRSYANYNNNYATWAAQEQAIRQKYTSSEMYAIAGSSYTQTTFNEEAYKREMAPLNRYYANAIIENALFEGTSNNEGVAAALQGYIQAYADATAVKGLQKTLDRVDATVEKSLGEPQKAAGRGSLAELEQRLTEAKKVASSAVGTEAQIAAQETVNELEGMLKSMKTRIAQGVLGPVLGETTTTLGLGATTSSGIAPRQLSTELKKTVSVADQATQSFSSLAVAVSALSGSLGANGQSWASYTANVLSAIATAIPAIQSMIVQYKAEKQAAGEAAAAEAAASTASIPIVGPLMAAASVASVVAAIVNTPKFANGGIVGGSSYSGDKLLVRANSGELILNQAQQRNLLGQLEGRSVNISGELKASGRDLVATFNNYNLYSRQ